jgi:predicted PurR-regulated permease PerM
MQFARTTLAAVAVLGLAFGATSLTGAGVTNSAVAQQAPAPGQAPAADEETLRSFAVATLEIQEISQTYQPQLEAAQSPEEQQEIAQTANAEMVQAVEAVPGINVDQYNAIAEAAQNDPQMMQQINTLLAEESAR